jgi:hypothetical protein
MNEIRKFGTLATHEEAWYHISACNWEVLEFSHFLVSVFMWYAIPLANVHKLISEMLCEYLKLALYSIVNLGNMFVFDPHYIRKNNPVFTVVLRQKYIKT